MNIALDLVLVLAFRLGVLGVALGTILAQAFSWLFGVSYINRHYPELSLRLLPRTFDRALKGPVKGPGQEAQGELRVMAVDIGHAEEPGERLGQDGPQGHPQDSQAEGQHQDQVQGNVHHRGHRQE